MRTIKLKVNEKVYKHFMWFLQRFKEDEVQVMNEDEHFTSVSNYLHDQLDELENGNAELISLDDLDAELDDTIRKHES